MLAGFSTGYLKSAWARTALAVVVVIVIVLVAVIPSRVREHEEYLSGFWSGDPAFLKKAGLDDMFVYIAPRERAGIFRWSRQGYLVMTNNRGEMISNQGIEITYSCPVGRMQSALGSHFRAKNYQIPKATFSCDGEAAIPEVMSISLNPAEGSLSFYDRDKLYAFLIKDNETSIAANEEYTAGQP